MSAEAAARAAAMKKRDEALAAAFDILNAYLTDECPDDMEWENFDPDLDMLRIQIHDEIGKSS